MKLLFGVAVAMATVLGCASPAAAQTRPADWLRKPTPHQMLQVWPTGALNAGIDGWAVIHCVVTSEGPLRDCSVRSEKPTGMGFGDAALLLTPEFVMRPALKDGHPVESEVSIPIVWRDSRRMAGMMAMTRRGSTGSLLPGGSSSPYYGAVVGNLHWLEAPNVAEVVASYPERARKEKVAGRATLSCEIDAHGKLVRCKTTLEEPRGYGFADAARDLSSKFTAQATDAQGKTFAGARTLVPFTFAPESLAGGAPVIGKPQWVALPTAADFNHVFPPAAAKAGVLQARVVLGCAVEAGGALAACRVESEDPPNYGFGAGAASLSDKLKVGVWTSEGLPTVGGTVHVPIRYALTQVPEGPTPAPSN